CWPSSSASSSTRCPRRTGCPWPPPEHCGSRPLSSPSSACAADPTPTLEPKRTRYDCEEQPAGLRRPGVDPPPRRLPGPTPAGTDQPHPTGHRPEPEEPRQGRVPPAARCPGVPRCGPLPPYHRPGEYRGGRGEDRLRGQTSAYLGGEHRSRGHPAGIPLSGSAGPRRGLIPVPPAEGLV